MSNKLIHNDTFNSCNLRYDVIKFSSRVPIASSTGKIIATNNNTVSVYI